MKTREQIIRQLIYEGSPTALYFIVAIEQTDAAREGRQPEYDRLFA